MKKRDWKTEIFFRYPEVKFFEDEGGVTARNHGKVVGEWYSSKNYTIDNSITLEKK